MPTNPSYGLLMLAGLAISALLWQRLSRNRPIPLLVFVGGLIGAILGAKLGYLLCELPYRLHEPHLAVNILAGRTILGGLLGGYLGVEWGKRLSNYTQPTGDAFALIVPIGLAIGRVGCWLQGCCPGRPTSPAWYALTDANGVTRFPAVPVEIAFNLAFAAVAWFLHRRPALRGQLFHIYLITYGTFRFLTEFYRDTPRLWGPITTYQLLAVALIAVGAERFRARRHLSLHAGALA